MAVPQELHDQAAAGWQIGSSILMELDVAISAIRDYASGANMPPYFVDLLRALPSDWREKLPPVVQGTRGYASLMETAGIMAGVVFEPAYSQATLRVRELSPTAALERLVDVYGPYNIHPDPHLPLPERVVRLGLDGKLAQMQSLGLEVALHGPYAARLQHDLEGALAVLQAEDFWFWLDRFYFEAYHGWRQQQAARLLAEQERAVAALGAAAGDLPPVLDWLPHLNPLIRMPALQHAIQSGQISVFFWVQPFQLSDSWSVLPGWVASSFSEVGPVYENFQAFADQVSGRLKALSDPTRLTILRLIRHFGMVNTEIANYLGISRPTVSIHAKVLREAGLIRSEQVGREMRHEIIPEEVDRLFQDLDRFLDLER